LELPEFFKVVAVVQVVLVYKVVFQERQHIMVEVAAVVLLFHMVEIVAMVVMVVVVKVVLMEVQLQ
jgi:hypothetical protein